MNQLSIFDQHPALNPLVAALAQDGGAQPDMALERPAPKQRTGQDHIADANKKVRKPGSGLRDSSRDAFHDHKAAGKLGKQQQAIYSFLTLNAHQDYTRGELAAAMGLPVASICGRCRELLDIKVISEKGRRECAVTGKSAHSVRAA